MHGGRIPKELAHHEYLRSRLQRDFPDADEETLSDTLEGLTRLPEMIGAVLRSHLDDLALVQGLRARLSEMQQRLARLEHRADSKRQIAASVMERADIQKVLEPDFTASLRRSPPKLVVVDENLIPEAFWRPQPPKLDRQAITVALKTGQRMAGARLDDGGLSLAVRTK